MNLLKLPLVWRSVSGSEKGVFDAYSEFLHFLSYFKFDWGRTGCFQKLPDLYHMGFLIRLCGTYSSLKAMWTLNSYHFPSTRSWTNKLKRFGLRTSLWRSHLMKKKNKLRKSPNYTSMYHLRSLLIHNKMLSFSSYLEKQSKLYV